MRVHGNVNPFGGGHHLYRQYAAAGDTPILADVCTFSLIAFGLTPAQWMRESHHESRRSKHGGQNRWPRDLVEMSVDGPW